MQITLTSTHFFGNMNLIQPAAQAQTLLQVFQGGLRLSRHLHGDAEMFQRRGKPHGVIPASGFRQTLPQNVSALH